MTDVHYLVLLLICKIMAETERFTHGKKMTVPACPYDPGPSLLHKLRKIHYEHFVYTSTLHLFVFIGSNIINPT